MGRSPAGALQPQRFSVDNVGMTPTARPARDVKPKSVFYRHELNAGVLTVRPNGPSITQREAMILNNEVGAMIKQPGLRLRALVLDLSDVRAMASIGLGVCIELRHAAHAVHARTIVIGLCDELVALFRLMKVDRLYTIVRTPGDLAAALSA
jgi:anti-anti-sigma factor